MAKVKGKRRNERTIKPGAAKNEEIKKDAKPNR
jgi:hypothetical protein